MHHKNIHIQYIPRVYYNVIYPFINLITVIAATASRAIRAVMAIAG